MAAPLKCSQAEALVTEPTRSLSSTVGVALPENASELSTWVRDARACSFALVSDLDDDQLLGSKLEIVNPLLWEIGHVAWFQEKWVLRHALGRPPLRKDADSLWDSIAIGHDTRWELSLPPREETFAYLRAVRDEVLEHLARGEPEERVRYFALFSIFHEDMHTEAFTHTRQTLGYPAPTLPTAGAGLAQDDLSAGGTSGPSFGELQELSGEFGALTGGELLGDAEVPGGCYRIGAEPDAPFCFDNEKWAHEVELAPFLIARAAVSQADFLAFVEDGGYRRRPLWSEPGWRWREQAGATAPLYWRQESQGRWSQRCYDDWLRLDRRKAMVHVNAYEADAYCHWAERRLPSEAEWEVAAAVRLDSGGRPLAAERSTFPWGDELPSASLANLDWRAHGVVDVHAHASGESAIGCRQMIGNTWEWTSSVFGPYPGFVPDPYAEYSQPWFDTRRVLRGGCWCTRSRLPRNTWRNFYEPHRRDVWSGFRTCALDA